MTRTTRHRIEIAAAFWFAVLCVVLLVLVLASEAQAERPVMLPRHAATPPQVLSVETIQRVYLSDGTRREKSLGVVTLGELSQ